VEDAAGIRASEDLVKALVAQGLYEKEARAMVDTWKHQWFAEEGSRVVVVDVADVEGAATVAEIERQGARARYVHADVSSPDEVRGAVATTIEWGGQCDLLVSNAAITGSGGPHEFTVGEWRRMIDIDLLGSVWFARELLPHMLDRGEGHLCFVTSGAGFQGRADNAPYAVAKFGLVGLAESLALYLHGSGVSVSLVAPGAIGGPHADTLCVAGASDKSEEQVEAVKLAYRRQYEHWPSPASMAKIIVRGFRDDRYYIIQEGPGHEDWLRRTMLERWADPEAFLARLAAAP